MSRKGTAGAGASSESAGSRHLSVIDCSKTLKLSGNIRVLKQVPAPSLDLHVVQEYMRAQESQCGTED